MICCLNPDCHNPPVPDHTKFCPNCGVLVVILRNRYRPLKMLGVGGFGKTYLSEDIDKLHQKCVIKQFAPQIQGTGAFQKATELFEQEARRLEQLGEHPQIPTLLAYFEENNRLYLVQQFIDGVNLLTEWEQQGNFSEKKIRDFLLDLLEILKTVHEEKVIHRDIKPENIIRREHGTLVLIDFGASKQLQGTVKLGTRIGTFGYASLEQMEDRQVYPASDLFSVGATCFHLMSGIHPWELWKKQGYGWVNNWREHLKQPISKELGRILDNLLREEYEERYQSAQDVLRDLNPLLPSNIPPQVTASTQLNIPPQVTAPTQLNTTSIANTSTQPKKKGKSKKLLLLAAILLGLFGIVVYSYIRYGFFAVPISLIINFSNDFLLEKILYGHSSPINSVAINPDGKTLVSGSYDNTIKIWDLQTGELKSTLSGHSGAVFSVAISPDGKTLVSGSADKTIKIWNLQIGELKSTLPGHFDSVHSVAISPDGKTLVSENADKTIKIWNLQTGELKSTLSGHSGAVFSVAISPDGKTLVNGSDDKTIKIWNLQTGELKSTLSSHSQPVDSVAISPDGRTLVSGSYDNTIKIWNLQTGELKSTLSGHFDSVHSVAISPDGKTLVSGSADKTIKIWNLQTGELKSTLSGHSDSVFSVAISPDGKTLVSGSVDKTIRIWRMH